MKYRLIVVFLLATLFLSGCDNDLSAKQEIPAISEGILKPLDVNGILDNASTTTQGDVKECWIPVEEFYEGADGSTVTYKGKINTEAFDWIVQDTSVLDIPADFSADFSEITTVLDKAKKSVKDLDKSHTLSVMEPSLGYCLDNDVIYTTITFTYTDAEAKSSIDTSKMNLVVEDAEFTVYSDESGKIAIANDGTWELTNAYYLVSEFYTDEVELSLDELNQIQQLKNMYVLTSFKGLSAVILTDDFAKARDTALVVVHNVEFLEMSSTSS